MDYEVTVKSTGRIFGMRDLTARQQMAADNCGRTATEMAYYRVAMSIAEIGGTPQAVPQSKAELDAVIDQLAGKEFDVLSQAYNERANPTADLKNE